MSQKPIDQQETNLLELGFSNFEPWQVTIGDLSFPTLEHAYQAAKTNNPYVKRQIALCKTPGQAKRLGNKISLIPRWDNRRKIVMKNLLRVKFSSGTPWEKRLLSTDDLILVEMNNWHDTFFGRCMGNCKQGPHEPEGENWLGVLLMERRERLRNDSRRKKNNGRDPTTPGSRQCEERESIDPANIRW